MTPERKLWQLIQYNGVGKVVDSSKFERLIAEAFAVERTAQREQDAKLTEALEAIELHVAYALEEDPDGDPKEMLKMIGDEVRLALHAKQDPKPSKGDWTTDYLERNPCATVGEADKAWASYKNQGAAESWRVCSNCECGIRWSRPGGNVCPDCGAPAMSNQEGKVCANKDLPKSSPTRGTS